MLYNPKESQWISRKQNMGNNLTRQFFRVGEILPTLVESDWGEVYWYFDGED